MYRLDEIYSWKSTKLVNSGEILLVKTVYTDAKNKYMIPISFHSESKNNNYNAAYKFPS